jgi:hypothetical protein
MEKRIRHWIIGVLLLGLSGCRIAYVPNMHNVPLFQEEKEFRGTITPSNFQVAYAPLRHLGIIANGQYYTFKEGRNDNEYRTVLTLLEGGAGAYFPVENTNTLVLEAYGGGGIGGVTIRNLNYSSANYRANTIRFFLQPAIGYTHEIVDVAFSTRLNFLLFSSVDTVKFNEAGISSYEVPETGSSYAFIEPAFTLRLGYRYVKLSMQSQVSLPVSMPNEENLRLGYLPFTFSVGIHVNVAPRFR